MKRILFICLGNICRSCAAEEIMRKLVTDAGCGEDFLIDSAGLIDYHEGEQADARMRAHAVRRGYRITHLSRPIRYDDFFDFDLIVGMDDSNITRLKALAPGLEEENKVVRMTDYSRLKVVDHVPDPYYGGDSGFENVIDILEDACAGLLESLCRPEG
ncbi:MAG: low molecular weight phosphotyrosine protein phosphatase [Paraprevotella sp.]|nr:low molecular weight phosphotyrosine protein phosphatase [Paraprevotella sp.]